MAADASTLDLNQHASAKQHVGHINRTTNYVGPRKFTLLRKHLSTIHIDITERYSNSGTKV